MWQNAQLSIKNCTMARKSLSSRDSTPLRRQLSSSEARVPLDQIMDPHLILQCVPYFDTFVWLETNDGFRNR